MPWNSTSKLRANCFGHLKSARSETVYFTEENASQQKKANSGNGRFECFEEQTRCFMSRFAWPSLEKHN